MPAFHKSHFRPYKYEKSRKGGDKQKLGRRVPWFTLTVTGTKKHGSAKDARNLYVKHLLEECGYSRVTSRTFSKPNERVLILSRK